MKRRGRGRPPRDRVDQLRARIWYWHVRARSNLSEYALSRRFAQPIPPPSGEPPKAFTRIRQQGIVPSEGNHRLRNFSLVTQVDADPKFRGTRDVYDSPFWELVRNPSMSLDELRPLIDRLMVDLGLARPNILMTSELGRAPLLPKPSQAYKEGLKKITVHRNLDALALLAALFRESLLFVELQYASLLQREFEKAAYRVINRLRAFGDQEHLSKLRNDLDRDLREFELLGMGRLTTCSTDPNRTNMLDSIRTPPMDRPLWKRLGGPHYPVLRIAGDDD